MATGEIEIQADELEILSRARPAALPARRRGRRRDDPAPLPLARPAPRADAAEHPDAGEARLDHPRRDGGGGVRRHRDADHGQADAGGGPRLPRSDAAPARAGSSRCRRARRSTSSSSSSPGSSATTRSRAASVTRISAPTGSRRSPSSTSSMAFPEREFLFELIERIMGRIWARVRGDRDRAAVPAADLGGGRPPLRLRQARPSLRPRDRGRDRGHPRLRLQGVRRRRLRPVPPDPARALARRAREARGGGEGVGGKGTRLPRLRRRTARSARRSRSSSASASSRSLPPSRGTPSSSAPTSRRWSRACSARSGSTSAASSG